MIAISGGGSDVPLLIEDDLCAPLVHEVAQAFLHQAEAYIWTPLQLRLQEHFGKWRYRSYATGEYSTSCHLTFSVKLQPEVLMRRGSVHCVDQRDRGKLELTLQHVAVAPVRRIWIAGVMEGRKQMITTNHLTTPRAMGARRKSETNKESP